MPRKGTRVLSEARQWLGHIGDGEKLFQSHGKSLQCFRQKAGGRGALSLVAQ